ncbi:MAG: flavodoxin-dependent (E)-4-hydroxy-3-methylbut-2-enyl-diphosphate synthase [Haemophilus parainfluenzae]
MSAVKPTIKRRESTKIYVGNVPIGGDAPIAVQSMTNTRTTDVEATVAQIKSLERVGADIVRVSVPTMDAAEAFKIIKQQVNVPLVADIHFDYRIALKVAEYGVDCLRINPAISVVRIVFVQWWIVRVIKISYSYRCQCWLIRKRYSREIW